MRQGVPRPGLSGGEVEYGHDLVGKLTQDSWAILAMVTLGVLATAAARRPSGIAGSNRSVEAVDELFAPAPSATHH